MQIPARIISGVLVPNKLLFDAYARKHGDGDYVLHIDPKEAAKSVRQLRFFHGALLPAVAAHTGFTKDEVKYYIKRKFGPPSEVVDIETGEIVILPKSLSAYTRAEMDDLIAEAVNWAASLGIHLNANQDV